VGTSATNANIVNPHARTNAGSFNGFRKIAKNGPLHTLTWKLTDLPDGTYQWSVQAIDTDLEGSAFPTKLSFTYVEPAFVDVTALLDPNPGLLTDIKGVNDGAIDLVDYDNDDQLELLVVGRQNSANFGGLFDQDANNQFVPDGNIAALTNAATAWGGCQPGRLGGPLSHGQEPDQPNPPFLPQHQWQSLPEQYPPFRPYQPWTGERLTLPTMTTMATWTLR
jgi:hypothetical protein